MSHWFVFSLKNKVRIAAISDNFRRIALNESVLAKTDHIRQPISEDLKDSY
jgi:hypothetical protein